MTGTDESLQHRDLARAIIDDCAALIVVLDREGRIVLFNGACERLTGYSSSDVLGRQVWDFLLLPEDIEPVKAVFADLRAGNFPSNFENFWLTKSGKRRLIQWGNTAVVKQGHVEYVIGTGVDVTEPRNVEEKLARFELGIQRSGEIIFLTDPDGKIIYVNPTFERVYGFSESEVLGQTPRILKSEVHSAEFYKRLWDTLLSGRALTSEITNKTKDGRLVQIEASANPVLDREQRIIGFLAIQRDITDRKRTEVALQASEERLRTLMEQVPEGVGVLSMEGEILYANPAASAMLGYPTRELVGKRVTELQHPDDRERAAARMRALFEQGDEYPSQYRLIHKDGHSIVVEIASRVIEYDGNPALLSTMRDLTERHMLESQLRQAQKMEAVGQLAGGIAHDFNNLLTVIQANTELIAAELSESDAQATGYSKEVQAAVARGKSLIQKLLAFGRREDLTIEPVDLVSLLTDFEPTLRRLLPEHIEIRIDSPPSLPTVLASAGSVEQIIMNLATNARNAMPEGGTLRMDLVAAQLEAGDWLGARATVPGEYICLKVTDTGSGMDEHTRARLFEPFFTTRRFGEGTGLGMAVVYGQVMQMDGEIEVESELGLGTTVRVYLPIAATSPQPKVAPKSNSEVRGGDETILVAEDESALRLAEKRSLEKLGYKVLLAADGEEALQVLEANAGKVDLVVTDVVMPRLGGRALYATLRDRGIGVPFLFTSGYTAGDSDVSAKIDPGLPFLAKPWTLAELATKVREVLDASRADS